MFSNKEINREHLRETTIKSRTKHRTLAGIGLVLAASLSGVYVLFGPPSSEPASANAPASAVPAVPVTVVQVGASTVTKWREFSGRLEAVNRVEIRPRVGGPIQSVYFREGTLVRAGDVLLEIDPAPYEAAVAQARAQMASSQAKLDLAKLQFIRGQRLSDNRTISQSDLDQRSGSYNEALADLRAAQAALTIAQLNLDYTKVRAPIAGRVGKREVTVGNLVGAGSASPPLTTLVSVDPIYASFNANEQVVTEALAQLPAADMATPPVERIPVEIGTTTDRGTPINGKLQLIDNEVDAASGTIGVRGIFPNPNGKLMPGQFVRVRMGEPHSRSLVMVTERAIGTDQDKRFVFVVKSDNTVEYRAVTLGGTENGMTVVDSGLNADERIVVNGLQRVRPGTLVDPQPEQTEPVHG